MFVSLCVDSERHSKMRTGFEGHGERLSPNYSLRTTLRDIKAMLAVVYINEGSSAPGLATSKMRRPIARRL